MRQVRWGVLGAAMAAVAAAGVWSLRGNAPETAIAPPVATESRAPAELERELRALRAELESLRQGQGRLARQVESVEGAAPRSVNAEGPPPAPEPTRPGDAERAAAEEARQARVAELDAELEAALHTEPLDAEWARNTEALVSGAFQGPDLAGSRLARVECRTRVCVLEVEHEGQEARAELLDSLMRVRGLQGQAVMRPAADGSPLTSRVYLSRAGERLPLTLRP
ncbi:hypothetical protein [Myxococcus sp. RHSTA-1-4]|uniref:hypothetical protein n=1 Tax=Myxococcus sp. RHSTA-1-4 TaxID=2874601 RepID=UPI001CBC144E|nr:hypothetical protein [Myxococcus sp. RHSTA-1-4]MBZ4415449.1 hypothetical protein [Myxococcus sp. RHSTA-1-4]